MWFGWPVRLDALPVRPTLLHRRLDSGLDFPPRQFGTLPPS